MAATGPVEDAAAAEALSVALALADAEVDADEESDRRGWSTCHPSMVIAPPLLGPVSRFRVPGESTMVLSDSWVFDEFDDDDDDEEEEEEEDSVDWDEDALPVTEAVAVAEAADALARMDVASDGEIVVVLAPELLLLLEPASTSWLRSCFWVSMNAIVGPARTAWVARSRTLLLSGCMSLVMKRPTGPSMPWGTMHWSNGSGMEVAMPPMSI